MTPLRRKVAQALKSLATHKTDHDDARGLAHLARTGFFKCVHMKSFPAHAVRSLIIVQRKLVGQRVTLENQISGLARHVDCPGAPCIKDCKSNCTGRSRGGLTTNIHAVVNAKGLPLRLALSAGQDHDSLLARELLTELRDNAIPLADRAYDSDAIRDFAQERGAWSVGKHSTETKSQEPDLLQPTSLSRPQSRGAALQSDQLLQADRDPLRQTPANFLAFIKLAAIRLW